MRYVALIGFAICRFSFAQIANSPMSISHSPTSFNHEWVNTSPLQFNSSSQTLFSANHETYVLGTDLSRSQLGLTTQRKLHRISALITHEGSSDLSSNSLNFTYCKKITKEIAAGVGSILGVTNYSIANQLYGGYQIFASYKLNKFGTLCMWHQKQEENQIQAVHYHFNLNQTRISAGVLMNQESPIFEVAAGFSIYQNLYLNTILSNGPYLAGISASGKINQWIFCGKVAYHANQLGFRPTIYINYVFQEQKSVDDRGVLDVVRKPSSTE